MAFPYPITGPIAPFNNVPINAQYYQPSAFNIANLTLGASTTVTTSVNHNYVILQQIRLVIPQVFGSYQLNELTGYVTSIPAANQVVVNINSLNADPFVANPIGATTNAQIMAIGDANSGALNSNGSTQQGTFIPGSFIDISPA